MGEIKTARRLLDTDLQVGVGRILGQLKPAIKEFSVGADLLLLISGDKLVADGGVRLFWVQFKLANDERLLELDVWSRKNAEGRTHFESLRGIHSVEMGSFSVYALGARAHDFYAAIPIDEIEGVNEAVRGTCKVDLGARGLRFQELMVQLAGDTGSLPAEAGAAGGGHAHKGAFSTAADVLAYVDAAASQQSIIPLEIVSLSSGMELLNPVYSNGVVNHMATLQ